LKQATADGKFGAMKFTRSFASLAVAICSVHVAAAQILTAKTVNGREIECAQSGLWSGIKDCGKEPDWNTYVFIGSISAVSPAPITGDSDQAFPEEDVTAIPEEIFLGKPPNPITVRTNQALCGPKIAVGDRWLFYIRDDKRTFSMDVWAGKSRPVSEAQDDIRILRLQQRAGNLAILRGEVDLGEAGIFGNGIPGERVRAIRKSAQMEYTTTTVANGRYEFQLLPSGDYEIKVDPAGSFRPNAETVSLDPGSCREVTIPGIVEGKIAGHVRYPDGSPVPNAEVVIASSDNTWYETDITDSHGNYDSGWLEAGDYVIGMVDVCSRKTACVAEGSHAGRDIQIPAAEVYYPGVRIRSKAKLLKLANKERKGIDIVVPKREQLAGGRD
jgi:hypothetical protein